MNGYASWYVLWFKVSCFSIICICMFMFMGLDPQMFWCMVASSLPVGWSGTLQCAIRALIVAWAWMGHDRSVNRGRFPTTQKKTTWQENFWKFLLSIGIIGSSEDLVWSPVDASDHLVERPPDEGPTARRSMKIFLSVKNHPRSVPLWWRDCRNVAEG